MSLEAYLGDSIIVTYRTSEPSSNCSPMSRLPQCFLRPKQGMLAL